MVFASFKGVGFPHGRKYGCRNGFDHAGNGGHRRGGGYLAHQGGWLSFPLLQHTWTSDIRIKIRRMWFTTQTDDLSKRTPLCCSSWLCLFDMTCIVFTIITTKYMSRLDSCSFQPSLSVVYGSVTLKSKTLGLQICHESLQTFDKQLQNQLWPTKAFHHF